MFLVKNLRHFWCILWCYYLWKITKLQVLREKNFQATKLISAKKNAISVILPQCGVAQKIHIVPLMATKKEKIVASFGNLDSQLQKRSLTH